MRRLKGKARGIRLKIENQFARDQWADGCIFCRRGVVCRDNPPDCARCGWFPAEAKRRKLERLATGTITIRKEVSENA